MAIPCRTRTFKNFYYEGKKLLSLAGESIVLCLYDRALIEFVFPSSHWNVKIEGLIGGFPAKDADARDEEVHTWNIIAIKQ